VSQDMPKLTELQTSLGVKTDGLELSTFPVNFWMVLEKAETSFQNVFTSNCFSEDYNGVE